MEQPELHLHPAMQQHLADFLLACARSGRQLIIETHSDHFVSRLRRRVAEDGDDSTRDLIAFVFAEMRNGKTNYRRVKPTRYGSLEEWPEGFVDQTAKESQAILRAVAKKKAADSRIEK
jgi:predicted ATPase